MLAHSGAQVAYAAFYDWLLARNLEKHIRKFLDPLVESAGSTAELDVGTAQPVPLTSISEPNDATSASTRKRYRWSRTHSHYALMGGYAFDMTDIPMMHGHRFERLTLTPRALLYMAEHVPQHIPDISISAIQDKSKADWLAKIIVCLQAVWFFAQVVGRLATRCPISLLELNTLLHALCCLLIYAAWWNKPLDVEEPSVVDAPSTCAAMFVASELSGRHECGKFLNIVLGPYEEWEPIFCWKSSPKQKTEGVYRYESADVAPEDGGGRRTTMQGVHTSPVQSSANYDTTDIDALKADTKSPHHRRLYFGQKFHHFSFIVRQDTAGPQRNIRELEGSYIVLSKEYLEGIALASDHPTGPLFDCHFTMLVSDVPQYYRGDDEKSRNDSRSKDYIKIELDALPHGFNSRLKTLAEDHMSWGMPELLEDQLRAVRVRPAATMFTTGLLAASSVYGGVHLIAWNNHLPSRAEDYLWKISCFIVAAPFPIALSTFCLSWFVSAAISRYNMWEDPPIAGQWAADVAEARRRRKRRPLRYALWSIACVLGGVMRGCTWIAKTIGSLFSLWRLLDSDWNTLRLLGVVLLVPAALGCLAILAILLLLPALYVAARVFLVVESFRALGHMPIEVYKEPEWSKYFPHFSAG